MTWLPDFLLGLWAGAATAAAYYFWRRARFAWKMVDQWIATANREVTEHQKTKVARDRLVREADEWQRRATERRRP